MDVGVLLLMYYKNELCWVLKSCYDSIQLPETTTEEIDVCCSCRYFGKHTCRYCYSSVWVCRFCLKHHSLSPNLFSGFPSPFFSVLFCSFHFSFLVPKGWHHHRAAGCCCDVEVETWKMSSWHLPLMLVWLRRGFHGYTAGVMCVAMVTQRELRAETALLLSDSLLFGNFTVKVT